MNELANLEKLGQLIDRAMNLAHRLDQNVAVYLLGMAGLEVAKQRQTECQRIQAVDSDGRPETGQTAPVHLSR